MPVTETRHFYDRRGRLIRSVTVREPEWTDEDRAEQLALAEYRTLLCPGGCGQLLADSTSHHDTGPEFHATSTTCRACAELLTVRRARDDAGQGDNAARLWTISMRKG